MKIEINQFEARILLEALGSLSFEKSRGYLKEVGELYKKFKDVRDEDEVIGLA